METSPDGDEQELIQPAELYRHIESWWGADFDDELIERMVNAPKKHQRAFANSIMPLWQNLESELSEIPSGHLRPALALNERSVDREYRRIEALRLLLYVHEVVLDVEDLFVDFFTMLQASGGDHHSADLLRQIARIRPFVEDGSIKFARTRTIGLPSPSDSVQPEQLYRIPEVSVYFDRSLKELEESSSEKHPGEFYNRLLMGLWSTFGATAEVCQLAASHKAHTLARSPLENVVIREILQRPLTDKRQIVLQKLAAMMVPAMDGANSLVSLRKSDADFRQWRRRLGEALSYVGELGNEESIEEAAEVVHAQLMDGMSGIEKAVKKSPALQAAKAGLTAFAITGISSMTTELLLGNPSVAAVAGASAAGAAAGTVLDAGRNYVKALQARRKGHLIMDVAMLFDRRQAVDN